MAGHDSLLEFYRSYGESSFSADEPAYAEVCRTLADYPDVVELIAAHDPDAQQPNLLFAAVHYLLLGGLDHPLGEVYYGSSDAAPAPLFADLVLSHRPAIDEMLATRRTQTNEVGRSSVLTLMLSDAQRRAGNRLAWIDLGTSGGLNLNVDQFHIDYQINEELRSTGPEDSPVQLRCEIRTGSPTIANDHADIEWRVGVDRSPVDVANADEARWLQACLWPSKTERHARLDAAIAVAAKTPPHIIEAEAVAGIADAMVRAPKDLALVMTTTWVWYYLPEETQHAVIDQLRAGGRRVWWYSLEGRGVVAELGQPNEREVIDSLIGLVEVGGGMADHAEILGLSHPHGAWLDWY